MKAYEKILARVAETRMQAAALAAEKKRLHDAWLAQNADLLRALDVAVEAQSEAEAGLRNAAIAAYAHDGNKQQRGVTIRVVKRAVYDPEQALAWATEHKRCLALDKRSFEQLAKSGNLDWVPIQNEPTAAIDSDLSEWLVKP